jgi:hypothetical protein
VPTHQIAIATQTAYRMKSLKCRLAVPGHQKVNRQQIMHTYPIDNPILKS